MLVVGGTGGIGLAVARAFAALGAEVTATGAATAEVEAAREAAPGLRLAVLDVTDSGLVLCELAPDVTVAEVRAKTGTAVRVADGAERRRHVLGPEAGGRRSGTK